MPYDFYDDQAGPAQYTPPECWLHHQNSTGMDGLQRWENGTYSEPKMLSGNATTRCEMRIPFYGTYAAIYGSTKGIYVGAIFHCHLEYEAPWGEVVREGVWDWRDSTGAYRGGRDTGQTLCDVKDIPAGNHTLVLGIEPDQVGKGLTVDQYQVSSDLPAGSSVTWGSGFSAVIPPETLRNTTASALIPSQTGRPSASSTTSPSSSSSPNNNRLGIGLGIGLGVGLLPLAVLVGLWCVRGRRAARKAADEADLKRLSIDTKGNWYPLNQGGRGNWIGFGGGSPEREQPARGERVEEKNVPGNETPVLPLHSTYNSNDAHPGSFFSSPSAAPISPIDSTAGHAGSFFTQSATLPPPVPPEPPVERVWQDLPRDAELEDPSAFRVRL